jgi:hypothetical protein
MKLWNSALFGLTSFSVRKLASSCHFLKFEIWIVQTESDGEMTKIKFVHLDELWNIGIHHFSIWRHLVLKKLPTSFHFLKFKSFTTLKNMWYVENSISNFGIYLKILETPKW